MFEVASLLLLIAAVGAVVLARRRGGIDEDGEGDARRVLTPLDLIRPRETGTMAEGVGGVPLRARGRERGRRQPRPRPWPAVRRGKAGW